MSVRLYMDVHVPRAITEGLRLRGVDVVTAQADGARRVDDAVLLDRATNQGRVLFTNDDDLLAEAKHWQKQFFEQGTAAFRLSAPAEKRLLDEKDQQIAALQSKLQRKHEVLSELMEEHVQLKKELGEP